MMVALCSVGKNETHRSSFPSEGVGDQRELAKRRRMRKGFCADGGGWKEEGWRWGVVGTS